MENYFDFNMDDEIDKKAHYYTASYRYNDKNQIIKKMFNLNPKISGDRYYLDHDLEVGKSKAPPIETYTYDKAGNLTSVYTYLNPEKTTLVFSIDYFYNDKNQLVSFKRRKATGMLGSFNTHFKRLNEFVFNGKGDVIKINSYENDEKTVHATYLYEYEGYDEYDNWTTCSMRIKDIPTKEPTMVINRIIEYYNE